jgi:hypothetical protein
MSKPVKGIDVGKPRITPWGLWYLFLYLGVPVMLLGALVDLAIQWSTGWCVGLWCMA